MQSQSLLARGGWNALPITDPLGDDIYFQGPLFLAFHDLKTSRIFVSEDF